MSAEVQSLRAQLHQTQAALEASREMRSKFVNDIEGLLAQICMLKAEVKALKGGSGPAPAIAPMQTPQIVIPPPPPA